MNIPDSADGVAKINIGFPIKFSLICGASALGLTVCFWYISGNAKDTLLFFTATVAAAGQITASFYTARLLSATIAQATIAASHEKIITKQRQEDIELAKQNRQYDILKYTARFGERWNDQSMYPARDAIRPIFEYNNESVDELMQRCETKAAHVIHVLNFIEEIANANKLKLIDETLAKAHFEPIVTRAWSKFGAWVVRYRIRVAKPALWKEVEILAAAWKTD